MLKLLELRRQRQNDCRELLCDKRKETGLAFAGPFGGDLSYRTVCDCFKRRVQKIGAPNARVHDLRHTCAVAWIGSGVDGKTLWEIPGPTTAAFTMEVYGRVSRQTQLSSAAKLETFIRNVRPDRNSPPSPKSAETRSASPI